MTLSFIMAMLGVALYSLASGLALVSVIKPARPYERLLSVLIVLGGLPILAVLILHGVRDGRIPAFGRFEALSWYVLAVSGAYLFMASKHHMRGIPAILLPFLTVLLVLAVPGVDRAIELNEQWPKFALGVHIVAAFGGYALFSLASFLAVAYLFQDYCLKRKYFGVVFDRFPALETLDQLMRQQVGVAFTLFTISIVFGFVMIRVAANASDWLADPKIAATGATWVVYAILLHLRTTADRHGRKVALATVAGILFVLFAFMGVHLMAESVHDFFIGAGD